MHSKLIVGVTFLALFLFAQFSSLCGQVLTVTQGQHINRTSLGASYTSDGADANNPTSTGTYTHGNPGGNDTADAFETVTSTVSNAVNTSGYLSAKSQVSGNALYGSASGGSPVTAFSSTSLTFTLNGTCQYMITTSLSFSNSGPVTLANQLVNLSDGHGSTIFGVIVPGTFQKSGTLDPGTYTISAQTGFSASSGGSADDSINYALQLTAVPEPAAMTWLVISILGATALFHRRKRHLSVAPVDIPETRHRSLLPDSDDQSE